MDERGIWRDPVTDLGVRWVRGGVTKERKWVKVRLFPRDGRGEVGATSDLGSESGPDLGS